MDLTILPFIKADRQIEGDIQLDNQRQLDEMLVTLPLPRKIHPWERWLLGTNEIIRVPRYHIGHILLRSTAGRCGLFAPPTYADPEFEGNLTLELWNGNPYKSFWITPNMKLFALEYVSCTSAESYRSPGHNYMGQVGVTGPKALT